ncbi:MAG: GNAT family N-acetyltransferase [Deinococcales bacterium]|nr:GNAT family N-acetyltransferase [Chitinophagaceae bacterium]
MNIRKALIEDCKRLLELIQELADYEKAPDEVVVSLQHFEESGFGANPVWWAFVAEDAYQVVQGFALYYIRYSTWKGQCVYLEDLLVTGQMRGRGVGKLLFEAVMQETQNRGCKRMCWQVLDWNEPAINFYKKFNAKLDPEWMNGTIDF